MNDERFILDFKYVDLKTDLKKDDNDNKLDIKVGQYVKLKITNQVVRVIKKPFVLNDKVLSDYLGLDSETNKELLFNNDNVLEIIDNNKTL